MMTVKNSSREDTTFIAWYRKAKTKDWGMERGKG